MTSTSNSFSVISLTASGTGLGSAVDLTSFGVTDVWMGVEGITTATVKLQGSVNGTDYYDIGLLDVDNVSAIVAANGLTADGIGRAAHIAPYVRAVCLAHTSGDIVATISVRHI